MDKLVGDLMRYILFMDHNKTPVNREDMHKNVLQEHKGITKQVISEAQKKFKDLFGFELVEVPKKASSKRTKHSSSIHSQYFRNKQNWVRCLCSTKCNQ